MSLPRRLAFYGGAGLTVLPLMATTNQLLGPGMTRDIHPEFFFHEPLSGAPPSRLTIGFPGLCAVADRYQPVLDIFQENGAALLANNGANVGDTPAYTLEYLRTHCLLEKYKETRLIGLSMGTLTLVETLRELQAIGHPVTHAAVISGPAWPDNVIWPKALQKQYRRTAISQLQAGPFVQVPWNLYWRRAAANAANPIIAGYCRSTRQMSPAAAISGQRLLTIGVHPEEGEFPDTELLVIEHSRDKLVQSCFPEWQRAFPNSRLVTIDQPGHADLAGATKQYREILTEWYKDE